MTSTPTARGMAASRARLLSEATRLGVGREATRSTTGATAGVRKWAYGWWAAAETRSVAPAHTQKAQAMVRFLRCRSAPTAIRRTIRKTRAPWRGRPAPSCGRTDCGYATEQAARADFR